MRMTMPKNKTCPIFLWMFGIVGSCGHELLLPELLQLLNRPDLEGFSAGVKIWMNVPSRDPGSTG